jgi:hypothetical protein
VALRKLHPLPFVCPFDVGDGAPQPWLTILHRALKKLSLRKTRPGADSFRPGASG